MVIDGRAYTSIQKSQRKDHGDNVTSSLQFRLFEVITTDASTKGFGATLLQEQPDGKLKPIGFASQFLSDTEKNMRYMNSNY